MKATLEFNLPEDTNEHNLAINAGNLASALYTIENHIRCRLKYNDDLSEETIKELKEIRDLISEEVYSIIGL